MYQFQQDLVDLIMIHLASIELYWSCCDYQQETIVDHNEVMILTKILVPYQDHFAHLNLSFIVLKILCSSKTKIYCGVRNRILMSRGLERLSTK